MIEAARNSYPGAFYSYMTKNPYYPASEAGALLAKLEKLYGSATVKRDALGRRNALPSEIERAIYGRDRQSRGRNHGR